MTTLKPNARLRAEGWHAVRPMLGVTLLVCLIASLPSLLSQLLTMGLQNETLRLSLAWQAGTLSENALFLRVQQLLTSPEMIRNYLIMLVLWLVTPVLDLGWRAYVLKLLRGEEAGLADVLSRAGIFLRAVGHTILLALYVVLWMLPGTLCTSLAVWFTAQGNQALAGLFSLASSVLTIWLGLRAALRVSLSACRLADRPESRAREALRWSRTAMARPPRSLQMLSMILLFILLDAVVGWMAAVLPLPDAVSIILSMIASLVISVWMTSSVCAFYENMRELEEAALQPPSPDDPSSMELPKSHFTAE